MKYTEEQLTVFKNKKIAILGLGAEGLSTGVFLRRFGAELTFFDQKKEEDLPSETLTQAQNLGKVITRPDAFAEIQGFDLIVRSPGISRKQDFLQKAEKDGVIITSQTKLFFDLCPCYIVGVTGSKGKGTTCTLIYQMLKESGRDAYLGGNIGVPPLTFLEQLTESSVVVLELSSYQLQDLTKSPHIAVMLMTVSEHLTYHGDMSEYIDAKRNLLRFQTKEDFAILNRDYIPTHESDIYTDGKVFQVTRERSTTEQGTFLKDGAIWMRVEGTEWKIIDTKDIALPGKHNWENAAAAAMAATLAGASKADIVNVLQTFVGLPHRLELIREVNGVKYYDDSIATNPESAIAAIEAFPQPKVLILGGVTEGSDFTQLGEVVSQDPTILAVIGIGKEWPQIRSKIKNQRSKILLVEGATSMHQVVQAASKVAKEGDIVLLSPACKSFDMFKSYSDRGDQFKEEVGKL